jgi:hypothetical protein
MLRYIFAVMFFIFTVSISQGLEVGDSALKTTFTSGDKQIKFTDFHGKFNLIVISDALKYAEFNSQLEQKTDVFGAKYDATVLRLQEKSEILVIDKSGYVRWKFLNDAGVAQSAIGELESELVKLKREEPLPIGSPAPDFRLVDAESGLPFSLSKYKGKKHVLATLLLQTY